MSDDLHNTILDIAYAGAGKRRTTYDQKSYDLATHFLADFVLATETDRDELAHVIQQAIEAWLEYQTERRSPSAP